MCKPILDFLMESIHKILYIGVWHHIKPVIHFPNVKEFIFIDTQPRSEWDQHVFEPVFYRDNFYQELINKCAKYNFILQDTFEFDKSYHQKIMTEEQKKEFNIPEFINPTLLTFINHETRQVIKYYISTNIIYNMTDQLSIDIAESDAMIISGYFPNIKVFDYFDKPKVFIGYDMTYYGFNEDPDDDDIINYLYNNLDIKYFSDYYLIKQDDESMVKCQDINELFHICDSREIYDYGSD